MKKKLAIFAALALACAFAFAGCGGKGDITLAQAKSLYEGNGYTVTSATVGNSFTASKLGGLTAVDVLVVEYETVEAAQAAYDAIESLKIVGMGWDKAIRGKIVASAYGTSVSKHVKVLQKKVK
jgi:predicted small lipoprotein YifL